MVSPYYVSEMADPTPLSPSNHCVLAYSIVRKSPKRVAPYYEAPIRHESCQTTSGCLVNFRPIVPIDMARGVPRGHGSSVAHGSFCGTISPSCVGRCMTCASPCLFAVMCDRAVALREALPQALHLGLLTDGVAISLEDRGSTAHGRWAPWDNTRVGPCSSTTGLAVPVSCQ